MTWWVRSGRPRQFTWATESRLRDVIGVRETEAVALVKAAGFRVGAAQAWRDDQLGLERIVDSPQSETSSVPGTPRRTILPRRARPARSLEVLKLQAGNGCAGLLDHKISGTLGAWGAQCVSECIGDPA